MVNNNVIISPETVLVLALLLLQLLGELPSLLPCLLWRVVLLDLGLGVPLLAEIFFY